MAMLPELAELLEQQGAQVHIHSMNLVRLRRGDPGRQGSAAAGKLLAQLAAQLMQPPAEAASPAAEASGQSKKPPRT